MGQRPLISFLKNNSSLEEGPPEDVDGGTEIINKDDVETPNEDPVESFKKDYASKLGWTTKEVWEERGLDPNNWRDYDHFLNTSPAYIEKLRKTNKEQRQRIERNAAAAAAAMEEERVRARQEAEREAREAATAGDPDRAAAAVARAAQSAVAPETEAWMGRNPWFNDDPEAQAVAVTAVNRAAKAGASISEQLQAAEGSVKKRFPEYFDEIADDLPEFITKQPQQRQEPEPEPKKEVRMSESPKVAAAANNPSARNRESKNAREKGFAEIPDGDKQLYEKHFARRFQSHGLSVDDARAKYAKTYWGNKG